MAAVPFKAPALGKGLLTAVPAPAIGPASLAPPNLPAFTVTLGSALDRMPQPDPAAGVVEPLRESLWGRAADLSPLRGLLKNGPEAARLAGQESGDAARSDSADNFNRAARLGREGHHPTGDAVDGRGVSGQAHSSALERRQMSALGPAAGINLVVPSHASRPTLTSPETFGVTDKRRGHTGYFEYKLDDQGRIWMRYAPILATKAFEIPVTAPPSAVELKARFERVAGPYTYVYEEARRVIVVTPKPDAVTRGFMLRGGRLVETDRNLAMQWQMHDGSGGPRLPKGVKIEGIQVSGEIIAARGSDGILYLYKPTVPDAELPVKWSSDNGTPFGGALRFPKARDWAFGLSIGVKPSQRPTLELMNPYTDIDNYYEGADGGKIFYGFTATLGVITDSGREIRYWDTGLPADFQRGFLTPHRGRVVGEKLAQAGSTWLLYGQDNGKPGLWVKDYDHEMLGSCPGLRYVFDPPKSDKGRIYDLADAQRYVPLPPWRPIDFPALEGDAILTDRISIHSTGQGNQAREIVIEGKDAAGSPGYYRRLLGDKDWTFVGTGETLAGETITPRQALVPTKPAVHDYPFGKWEGFRGAPIADVELNDFHPFLTLDEASTLRITLKSGKEVSVLLRTSDAYSPLQHDARDDGAIGKGIGEEKVLTGTLSVPPDVENSPDPEIRAFVRRYLKPYHHIPNLFVVNADRDHVDIRTKGRYRKSDKGFDYGRVPELSISVKRDARGESEYELLASVPALKASAGLSAGSLDEVIANNEALKKALRGDMRSRRARHLAILIKTLCLSAVSKAAFFFMDLFGATKKKYMGPISDIVPRFMEGHLCAHDLHTPEAYHRAVAIIEKNIRSARAYKNANPRPF